VASPRFLAVGDLMVDMLVSGGPGHKATIRLRPGGSAANAAVWATEAGAEATVLGAVGDDSAGRLLQAELQAWGVRPELRVDPEAPTGSFLVLDGEIRADRGANARFAPEDLPAELQADVALISGHLEPETIDAALARARAPWVALDAARLHELPQAAPVVLLNEERARDLTGSEPEEAARRLAEGRRIACVTSGAAGAVALLDGRTASARPVDVSQSDEAGSGDAFAASFLLALARGLDLEDALVEGCRTGALAAKLAGAWPRSLS
jgi:sugar/nucleoside kinase (ribokinase family)